MCPGLINGQGSSSPYFAGAQAGLKLTQGSSANSVGGDSGQDERTDGQTVEITT
ncbi:hypothetical protein DPMN_074444 [Dreissena polymorpha]|uniref:Uncharacterized protein n=1 Tax=Dreissena polymorpha TaxID=45954 RepID=A0A9D3YIM6_DREPO|nr:hypothetical protein DPMN_074444 [Dreissena polymorpha]